MDVIVDTAWLEAHLDQDDLCIVDVRPPQFYSHGHIPGAVNLPIFLLGSPSGGAPQPAALAQRLGQTGVSPATPVVVYDEGEGASAGQLFWLLQLIRHPEVAVLDGGFTAWVHEDRRQEYDRRTLTPAAYRVDEIDESVLAQLEDVRGAIDSSDRIVVDVRTPGEYLGLRPTAARNGHIPGAINVDAHDTVVAGPDGVAHFADPDELRRLFESAGATADKEVIVHCQSGHRSSGAYLALKHLGYPRVRNYYAGWQEWGNRPETPIDEA